MTAKTFSRAWLLSPAPESRRQAAWGQRYQAWLAFRRNPLAMAGLIVVVLLLALSLMVFILLKIVERKSWVASIVGAVLAFAFGWGVFGQLLSVPLPTGMLGII